MVHHEIIGDDMQAVVLTLGAGASQAYKGDREDVKRDLGGTFGALGDLLGGDS